ncbi:MAG: gamma-glutamyl-gamma-aminobutyrate hydrolase family protein, partial [candidate division Zixibacteria bacterium]|nr:gamma-glutamyl-gamma-aminobutyrate hydrolase family protein [Candidatus Saccharibacteria bacterium]NIS47352.1 gamma-glutamyl-gamma-aminobutyrate hydrolase family protein [candidate division Zixibacteria bacterium]NIV07560.1 gamma-glutamyl-gamma-aminobutyrate hydrolase family protein [candidate division Zixibacteria bacterium]
KDDYGYRTNYQMDVYLRAVQKAGGLPVMIPLNLVEDDLENLITRVDGILLSGG